MPIVELEPKILQDGGDERERLNDEWMIAVNARCGLSGIVEDCSTPLILDSYILPPHSPVSSLPLWLLSHSLLYPTRSDTRIRLV